MNIKDWITSETNRKPPEKIGILSDAHGNHLAFTAAIDFLSAQGATDFLFLGDSIGYIPNYKVIENITKLKDRIFCLKGNHEEMLLRGGIDKERDKIYQLETTRGMLNNEHIAEIIGWPKHIDLSVGNMNILAMHGSPNDFLFDYIYPDSDLKQFQTQADIVFVGNTHRAFMKKSDETLFVNVGSCGMPRDDGQSGSVALWDTLTGEVELLRFDIKQQTSETLASCLPVHQSVLEIFERKMSENG